MPRLEVIKGLISGVLVAAMFGGGESSWLFHRRRRHTLALLPPVPVVTSTLWRFSRPPGVRQRLASRGQVKSWRSLAGAREALDIREAATR